jgi:hypothetical protein
MRWKISHGTHDPRHHGGHDPRHIDLLAAFVLVIVIVAACRYFGGEPEKPSTTAFIVPSQSVRW